MVGEALGLFAVTNIDDLLMLSLFFAQGAGHHGATARTVAGQYLGFAAILAVSVLAACGISILPGPLRPLLGLIPLTLGLRAVWRLRRERGWRKSGHGPSKVAEQGAPGTLEVAGVTFANGGDNVAAYVPVLAVADGGDRMAYSAIFLVLVALLCAVGRFLATRTVVARILSRWGTLLVPFALIAIGLSILV